MEISPERIHPIREGRPGSGTVVYWMSRDQRARDNWALLFAQSTAIENGLPLIVVFCLADSFLGATLRQYGFMLRGLEEVSALLRRLSVPFFLLHGDPPETMPGFIERTGASFLVTDFDPIRLKRQWLAGVARRSNIPFYEVDAHNIVPCRAASDKREYAAFTIRKKIQRLLPRFLEDIPAVREHPYPFTPAPEGNAVNAAALLRGFRIDRSVKEADWIVPGEDGALKALDEFLKEKLDRYGTDRNDPLKDCQSGLSPYLHFGHISAQRVALEAKKCVAGIGAKNAFLEELIIRRELSDNYCHHTPDYDRFASFPEWARKTLDEHRGDRRPYLYSLEELNHAKTHDGLWNAAQKEMTARGKMHGYMRMYWAKKILEWTASPEDALSAAIYLNDRYELDGRDPNGYAGIAWSIGGVHDRAWNERNVFGKIRYMSYNGCATKFNVKRYMEKVSRQGE